MAPKKVVLLGIIRNRVVWLEEVCYYGGQGAGEIDGSELRTLTALPAML